MPAFPTNFPVNVYSSGSYQKNDIVLFSNEYFYATQDSNGISPADSVSIGASTYSRQDNRVTVSLSTPSSVPFAQGSFVEVNIPTAGFTGCLIDGNANVIQYVHCGPNVTNQSAAGGSVYSLISPAWTTGFGWIPAYNSNLDSEISINEAKFGDGYSQRSRNGINTISNNFSLKFDKRSSKEALAILNYVQNAGNVTPIKINFGDGYLQGKPNIKFYLGNPKVTPESYNVCSVMVPAVQSFNI